MNRAHTSVRGPDVLIPGSQRFSRWRRLISWAGGLTSLLLMGAPNLPGQAGSVDPTFAPSPGLGLDFRAMALAPDGSVILALHESDGGIGVTRVRRLDRFGAGDPNFHSPQFDFGGSDILAVQADGSVLVAGYFTAVDGFSRQGMARLWPNGTVDDQFDPGSGSEPFASISAMATHTNGQVIVAGRFTTFNGVLRAGVARLNSNGTLDSTFNPGTGANSFVNALTVGPDGKVLLGGSFSSFNGVSRLGVVRLNLNGSVDSAFVPALQTIGEVHALALQPDGKVIVSGHELGTAIGRPNVIRLNANGSLDSTFQPGTGAQSSRYVDSLARQPDGRILVGGDFTDFAGVSAEGIVRLNTDGTLDPRYDPGSLGQQLHLHIIGLQPDGGVIVMREQVGAHGVFQRDLLRLLGGDTSAYAGRLQFAPIYYEIGETSGIVALQIKRTRAATGTAQVRYEATGEDVFSRDVATAGLDFAAATGMVTLTNGQTNAVVQLPIINDNVAEPIERFAVTLLEPGPGTAIGPDRQAFVQILDNDSAFEFNQPRYRVRESSERAFLVVARRGITTPAATVEYLTVSESATAGADFIARSGTLEFSPGQSTQAIEVPFLEDQASEGLETFRVVLQNPTGGAFLAPVFTTTVEIEDDDDIGPGALARALDPKIGLQSFAYIQEMARYSNGDILLAGSLDSLFGPFRFGMMRMRPDGSPDNTFQLDSEFSGFASLLLLQADGHIVYNHLQGLARLNANGSIDPDFNVAIPQTQPIPSRVSTLAQDHLGRILVAGFMPIVAGADCTGLARLGADGSLDHTFHPTLALTNLFPRDGPGVLALAVQSDNKIIIAGDFDLVDGVPRKNLARLNEDGSLDTTFDGGRIVDDSDFSSSPRVSAMTVQPDGRILLAGNWNLVRGVRGMGVIRLESNGALDSSFTPAVVDDEFDFFAQLALEQDGKILLAPGHASVVGLRRFGLTRLQPDGFIDPTFDPGPSFDEFQVSRLLVESSGDVLVAGSMRTVDGSLVRLVRLRGGNASGIGRCEFHQAAFRAWESNGVATITVDRRAGAVGTATVHYEVVDQTATNGLDYALEPGSVTFNPGETSRTFNVTILKDRLKLFPDQFILRLQAGPGAILGSQSNATVEIVRHVGGLLDDSFEPRRATTATTLPGDKILTSLLDFLADDVALTPWSRLSSEGFWEAGLDFHARWDEWAQNLAVRGDGAVSVFLRNSGNVGRLTRVLFDGSIDPTFAESSGEISAMALEAGGKLIVNRAEYLDGGNRRNRVVRFNVDGSVDGSFQSLIINDADGWGYVRQLVLQADGKILVGGEFSTIGGTLRPYLSRLNRDGSLDAGFAPDAVNTSPSALVLQADGKILVAHQLDGTPIIQRLRVDGSLDLAFQIELDPGAFVDTLLVQGDGKILVGGRQLLAVEPSWEGYLGMARLLPTGELDLSFASRQAASSAFLQADGRVVALGDYSLVRMLNDSGVGAGRVDFEVSSFHVSEAAQPSITLALRRTGGSRGAVSVNMGSFGTATAGADCSMPAELIQFADGEVGPKTVTLQIHNDLLAEGPETLVVLVGNPIGGVVLGQQSFAEIHIDDDDTAVEFSEPVYQVREREGQIVVPLRRWGATEKAFSVTVATAPGTAAAGRDYHSQNFALSFAAGETNKTIPIPLIDDDETESNETFRVVLSEPTAGVLLGTNAQASVVIRDDDRPGAIDLRFDPDPIVESYNSFGPPNSRFGIRCMARQDDGRILLGGAFAPRELFRPPVQGLVRLLPNGALDGSFAPALPQSSQSPIEVTALALAPGNRIWVAYHGLYQGGINAPFNDVGTHLVLLNQYGFLEPSFEVTFTGTGSIDSLAVDPDGRLLAAGTFEMVNGVARRGVVRLFPDGRMDPSFDPGTGVLVRPWYGRVNGLAYQADGRILLAGEFEQVNAVTRIGVVRLARDGSVDPTFDPGRGLASLFNNWTVESLLLQPDGRVLVAGSFEMFDGVPRAGLARLESDGSLDVGFDPGNIAYPELTMGSSAVTALALARHGRILVGGIFTEINGVPRNRLARLNPDGSLDGGFDSQLGGWDVRVLAEEETGQVLIGGMFTDVDGIFRPGLARLNGGVFGFEFESVKLLANARARLNFEMPRGQRWFIEGSSDLMNWMVINPTRPLLDIDEFTDTSTPANEKRFYRAVKVP